MSPFFVQSSQFAYFLSGINLTNRLKVASIITSKIKELDGAPTILPFPDDAPPEIPRISLTSQNQEFVCNVSLSRIDFINKTPEIKNGKPSSIYKAELTSLMENFNEVLFKELSGSVFRLGLIMNYYTYPQGGGLDFLNQFAIGEETDAKEIQLHKLSENKINNFAINNWTRLVANKDKKIEGRNPLLVISDINTLQNEQYEITQSQALRFFTQAFELSLENADKMIDKKN